MIRKLWEVSATKAGERLWRCLKCYRLVTFARIHVEGKCYCGERRVCDADVITRSELWVIRLGRWWRKVKGGLRGVYIPK